MNSNQSWQQFQCLHPQLIAALTQHNLTHPTRIQAEVFSHYPHYHDFLIAAQTGSGKTLAFAAPILSQLQYLRQNLEVKNLPHCILGLILTPTRQLAQQIHANMTMALQQINSGHQPINQIKLACIIGGMSKQKQLRILSQRKPQIIIGTPGRLHELLDEQIISFTNLKYLVIDEADRMIEMGHFKQIDEILEKIFVPVKQEFFDKDFDRINRQLDRKAAQELNEFYIKDNGKKIKLSFNINTLATEQLFELPADMFKIVGNQQIEEINHSGKQKKHKKQKQITRVQQSMSSEQVQFLNRLTRRIFFISATLTRQFKGTKYFIKKARTEEEWKQKKQQRKQIRKQKEKQVYNKNTKQEQSQAKDGIEQTIPKLKALLSRAQFSQKPKIVDQSSLLFIPEKLVERVCFTDGDMERITLMISYIQELPPLSKCIIFCNTIKSSKRIQFFLEAFGLEILNLHSHMQQKQRLKRLQKFKKSTLCNILVATDVAARGLDFNITHVIQFGVPVNGDTYVHRAGRTARAMREGEAFILVDKKQANRWAEINDIIAQTTPNRKLQKYLPAELKVQEVREKVEKLQWIRRNEEKEENSKARLHDEQDAQNIGVQMEEQAPRKKYDLDREEEQMVRHEVKRRVETIRIQNTKTVQENQNQRWRKNKLVLSPDEIRKLL